MLGEGRADDTELLDNLITEAILRTYKRAAIRPSNPIPTFSDLRDELAQWRDEDKNERVMDEAHLAAIVSTLEQVRRICDRQTSYTSPTACSSFHGTDTRNDCGDVIQLIIQGNPIVSQFQSDR
jgi:hypothetical protein